MNKSPILNHDEGNDKIISNVNAYILIFRIFSFETEKNHVIIEKLQRISLKIRLIQSFQLRE